MKRLPSILFVKMKNNKIEKYQFDLSKPYFIHRSKAMSIIYAILSFLLLITGLFNRQESIILIGILPLIIAFCNIHHKNKTIQINDRGIIADEIGLIEWNNIQHCFYSSGIGKNPRFWLNIKMKDGNTRTLTLNNYSYDERKLAVAINFYSGMKIFDQTKQDNKEELKGLLIGFLCIFVVFLLIILLLSIHNGEMEL
ncbi:hypothetical protein [Bacteroides bouchesdurhonensis]|uniref:hypothetical protein n=1 Tax=Bacteroides bouchesdurhonensis TaxID=1841855 RepID=UPI0011DD007F|nr:hypothetical protein [Bacteroides bouchesdurhonensis]